MECNRCVRVFSIIGQAFNSPMETQQLLERVARILTEQFRLKGCMFRLLSRDRKVLEDTASYGLSRRFVVKGPVAAERSMAEALHGRVVLVENCATDPRIQYPAEHEAEGIVTCLTVPLTTRGQVIGTMRLFAGEPDKFSPLDIEIATIVAAFATRAITHCMFNNMLERVTDSIRTILDPGTVLTRVVEVISQELRAKGATVHLLEPQSRRLALRAHSGLSQDYLRAAAQNVVEAVWPGISDGCVQLTEPGDFGILPDPTAVRREGIASQLFVPLGVHKQVLGVLGVYTNSPYHFNEDELYFMQAIGGQCALAIENAHMYARLEEQYQNLANDFQLWFEHPHPLAPAGRS